MGRASIVRRGKAKAKSNGKQSYHLHFPLHVHMQNCLPFGRRCVSAVETKEGLAFKCKIVFLRKTALMTGPDASSCTLNYTCIAKAFKKSPVIPCLNMSLYFSFFCSSKHLRCLGFPTVRVKVQSPSDKTTL